MGISQYIKEIGRGKDGARALSRAQAADLLGQVLDGAVSDLEIGAFCLAMRIKGETPEEMAGFLDAAEARLARWPVPAGTPAVVLPSYNGARKLPLLTPLLALLLAREGLAVLIHGTATEAARVKSPEVWQALGRSARTTLEPLQAGDAVLVDTATLCPGLKRLLDVRRVVGLRNPAHSLVKLMNPLAAPAVIVGSYTHPEYAVSMADTFRLLGRTALLLRGTEGEVVADPRRQPRMDGFVAGQRVRLADMQPGSVTELPDLPAPDATSTARWIREVLEGQRPVPAVLTRQVDAIARLAREPQSLAPTDALTEGALS